MKVNRILVPVDFSESSFEGVKMAARIASLYGSTVDLIHVIPVISYFNESIDLLEIPLDFEKDLYPKALKIASTKLHELADEFISKEHRGKLYDVVGRKVFREVTELANKHHDMIVMSNKGGHGSDSVRSHITEKIIQYSTVPVLSIADELDTARIKEILVPLDRSEDCGSALVPAFELAHIFKSNLTAIHIIEPYTLGMEVPETVTDSEETIYENLFNNLSQYFEDRPDLNMKIERTGTSFEDRLIRTAGSNSESILLNTIVKKGISADEEICDYADSNADLVVMGTHGRTGISRFLLGSTTSRVAQGLHKPLLTFRPEG